MTRRLVVMAASAGGIEALQTVLRELSPDFDAPVLIVLHMAAGGGGALPGILNRAGPLRATAAVDGEQLSAGRVYVCVADNHLLVGERHLHVRRGPRENGHRPAADPLFRSAALYYGPRAVGVVLSGNLSDGTAGLLAIRRQGGIAVVQDPADALYDGMPLSALRYVGADHVLPAAEIGPLLNRMVKEPLPSTANPAAPDHMRQEVAIMEDDEAVLSGEHPGEPSPWPCPDCSGVLWQIDEGNMVRFRCRVGHAWSADDLLNVQGSAIENALWMALRSLEDRAALSRTLAERALAGGRSISAGRFQSESDEYEESVRVLRELLSGRALSDAETG
jgi:two-component system chemotaxis response regulator CheB